MIVAVALDLGTTTIKAGLLAQDGTLRAVTARPAPMIVADGGRYESDAGVYAATADSVLSECLAQTDGARDTVGRSPLCGSAPSARFVQPALILPVVGSRQRAPGYAAHFLAG